MIGSLFFVRHGYGAKDDTDPCSNGQPEDQVIEQGAQYNAHGSA